MKRMKQKEWLNSPRNCCPVCRSTDIDSTGSFDAHEYEMFCSFCGQTYVEVMKLVGYRIVKKEQRSHEANECRERFDAVTDYEKDRADRHGENASDVIYLGKKRSDDDESWSMFKDVPEGYKEIAMRKPKNEKVGWDEDEQVENIKRAQVIGNARKEKASELGVPFSSIKLKVKCIEKSEKGAI